MNEFTNLPTHELLEQTAYLHKLIFLDEDFNNSILIDQAQETYDALLWECFCRLNTSYEISRTLMETIIEDREKGGN